MRDFTLETYRILLRTIIDHGYQCTTYKDFYLAPEKFPKQIVLRHDVDKLPLNSLRFSKIQEEFGVTGTYYFRITDGSFDPEIIKELAAAGHEVGYHYETLDFEKGNLDRAYSTFVKNLEHFRKLVPVVTVCMHGSPLSKFDNRDLWKKFNYHDLGIIAEPYFDLDFNSVFYLTDTGRRWDGDRVSIRDKVMPSRTISNESFKNLRFHSSSNIIQALKSEEFPKKAMFTFHPQRWSDSAFPWYQELVLQNAKNIIKRFIA